MGLCLSLSIFMSYLYDVIVFFSIAINNIIKKWMEKEKSFQIAKVHLKGIPCLLFYVACILLFYVTFSVFFIQSGFALEMLSV